MSFHLEGQSCPVCHAYLFDDDDVVFCPVCGAPHHRDCYNHVGHCALENLHGTPNQYSRTEPENKVESRTEYSDEPRREAVDEVYCAVCRSKYDRSLKNCPKCGAPNLAGAGFSMSEFDALGGVAADTDLGEGVTAEEARRFVATNTHRYIPKFTILNRQNKTSWNWMAFLFPCAWFLSRKMYKNGIVVGILWIAASLLFFPASLAMSSGPITRTDTYYELFEYLINTMSKAGLPIMIMAVLSLVFHLALQIFSGLLGDYLYKNHAISQISQIKRESEDIDEDFRKKGGVNFLAFMLGILAVNYFPMVIEMFL